MVQLVVASSTLPRLGYEPLPSAVEYNHPPVFSLPSLSVCLQAYIASCHNGTTSLFFDHFCLWYFLPLLIGSHTLGSRLFRNNSLVKNI